MRSRDHERPRRINVSQSQNQSSLSCVRTCKCSKRFVPPANCPHAKICRGCHQAQRQSEVERQARLAAKARREAEDREMVTTLKEAHLSGTLPKSAVVRSSGRQRVVNWMGRSVTFYVAA